MTIDRAIKREQAKAEEYRAMSSEGNAEIAEIYIRCSKYHEQLAEWLEELKDYRDKNKMVVRIDVENMDSIKDKVNELSKYAESQYSKAIDDFVENISLKISESIIWGMIADCFKYQNMNDTSDKIVDYVINTANEIAEQLKAGGENNA